MFDCIGRSGTYLNLFPCFAVVRIENTQHTRLSVAPSGSLTWLYIVCLPTLNETYREAYKPDGSLRIVVPLVSRLTLKWTVIRLLHWRDVLEDPSPLRFRVRFQTTAFLTRADARGGMRWSPRAAGGQAGRSGTSPREHGSGGWCCALPDGIEPMPPVKHFSNSSVMWLLPRLAPVCAGCLIRPIG